MFQAILAVRPIGSSRIYMIADLPFQCFHILCESMKELELVKDMSHIAIKHR